jgi:DNA-binding transcriptional LysR family regulator
MGPQVHAALVQLQAAVAPADFSPATSERRFVLAAGTFSCAVLTPSIVGRMTAESPLAELSVEQYTKEVFDRLDAHRIDFAVGGVIAAPARFTHEVIIKESLAWVVRSEHPLAQLNRVELEDLVSVPHVVISGAREGIDEVSDLRGVVPRASWDEAGAFGAALAAEGLIRRIGVSVPDSYAALAVVLRSDMVTLIPRRLALLSAQQGRMKLIEPPYQSPSVDISLIYLKERRADPAIAWMRDVIRDVAAAI